jgi:Tol biopolymer transport system component
MMRYVSRRVAPLAGGLPVVLAVLLVAVLVPSSSESARRPWPAPRTLFDVANLVAFAQDGSRIAWIDSQQRCFRLVQIRTLASRVTRSLVRRDGPTCSNNELGGFEPSMALAGERAIWSYFTVSLSHYAIRVVTGTPGSRDSVVKAFEVHGGFEDDDHTPPLVPMAGDRSALVFAGFKAETSAEPGNAFRVRRRAAVVRATEATTAVAAAGTRFAVARRFPAGCVCNSGPLWSPDASKLAFTGGAASGLTRELHVVDADGRNLRTLASAEHIFVIGWGADSGRIVYLDSSGIASVGLSGRIRRLTRARWGSLGVSTLSPDRRLLTYTTSVGAGLLHVLDTASGRQRVVASERDSIWPVRWSPDGSTLAYSTSAETPALRVVSIDGGSPRSLATLPESFSAFAWSPSSREIAFERGDGLAVVATDTGAVRPVVAGASQLADWSPDGSSLAFWRLRPGQTPSVTGLHVVAADGTSERRVGGPGVAPAWSPDSTELLYQTDANAVHVAHASGAGERRLVDGLSPAWSRSGGRVAYLVPSPGDDYGGEIGVVNRDGSGAANLTRTAPKPEHYQVEVRRWHNGLLARKFSGRGRVEAVALSDNRVALLTGTRVRKLIEIRRLDGRLLRATTVPRSVALELAMADRWVVFRTGRTLRVLDVRAGATSVLTRAGGNVVGLSIEGHRVAWGERRRGPDRIRAIVLPK